MDVGYQIYLFLVLGCIVGGAVLASTILEERVAVLSGILAFLRGKLASAVLAGLMILFGLIALFSFHLNQPYFIADLLPSLGLILGGITLLYESFPEKIRTSRVFSVAFSWTVNSQSAIGISLLVLGLVHLLLPNIILI